MRSDQQLWNRHSDLLDRVHLCRQKHRSSGPTTQINKVCHESENRCTLSPQRKPLPNRLGYHVWPTPFDFQTWRGAPDLTSERVSLFSQFLACSRALDCRASPTRRLRLLNLYLGISDEPGLPRQSPLSAQFVCEASPPGRTNDFGPYGLRAVALVRWSPPTCFPADRASGTLIQPYLTERSRVPGANTSLNGGGGDNAALLWSGHKYSLYSSTPDMVSSTSRRRRSIDANPMRGPCSLTTSPVDAVLAHGPRPG